MNRITNAQLDKLIFRLNTARKQPLTSWTKGDNGLPKANIGNYHIDSAYGGVRLVQHMNESGGIDVISVDGFGTKRQLDSFLRGMLA